MLLAPEGAVCAGTFTQSLVRASCVDLCIDRLKARAGKVRAVLINSGQANACIGEQALLDSLEATDAIAESLRLAREEVLICSTGVIGVPILMQNLLEGINPLIEGLSPDGDESAAKAIMTTDLIHKQIAYETYLGGQRVRIGGMAKGSGMIHPDMATMLGFLSCDVGIPADLWQEMISRAVDRSFNAITVDGDTSTNDSLLAFSAGESLDKKYLDDLEIGLTAVMQYLAKAIARDGEGATCLLEVNVQGADSAFDARKVARTICGSSLVKTALHGGDPNWGRIIAAAARAGVAFLPENLSLWIGPYQLMQRGEPQIFEEDVVSAYIKKRIDGDYLVDDCVNVRLVIGNGLGHALAWGCDLSDQYVRINADYTT